MCSKCPAAMTLAGVMDVDAVFLGEDENGTITATWIEDGREHRADVEPAGVLREMNQRWHDGLDPKDACPAGGFQLSLVNHRSYGDDE